MPSYGALFRRSFGVILYIILSGYPPFEGEDDQVLYNNICAGKYSFVDEVKRADFC